MTIEVEQFPPPPGLIAWRAQNSEKTPPRCANCGVVLEGPFCHACGQAEEDFERSISSLLPEAFENLFHADGRLPRTLPHLILKPATLTRDYLSGRRAAQTPPLRLFLVVVLLVFFAGGLREMTQPHVADFWFKRDSPTETVPLVSPGANPIARSFAAWINPRLSYAVTHQQAFGQALESQLHRLAIAFLPIATLILGLLFAPKRRFFLFDHAVFSMHSLAFMGLLFTLVTLLGIVPSLGGLAGLISLAMPAHLFFHLRGVYGTSIVGTLVRMALLLVLSLAAVALLLTGVVGLGLNGIVPQPE